MQKHISLATVSIVALLTIGCGGGSSKDKTPEFTAGPSTTVQVQEGAIDVTDVVAQDDDTITFAITGGPDADKFTIDPQTGKIAFKEAPDYENPTDADKNNSYVVTVQATDADGKSATQTVTITVVNNPQDDGPAFESADHASLKETTWDTKRQLDLTVSATGSVKYAIDGVDKNRFALDNDTNKLRFVNFMPDYERPSDADRNNVYEIDIVATDDQNYSSRQHFTVTITNDPADDSAEANWVHIYKTGADDGIVPGDTFGDDRAFEEETKNGDHIVKVGSRMWQDTAENRQAAYSFEDAAGYCTNLDYAGYSDWRVPNRHEMYEIVNYGNAYSAKPTIDDIFEHSAKGNYWTSENVIGHSGNILTNQAFAISFTDGASYALDRGANYKVRCVRGDELRYTDYISKDADDIYRDPKTGFWWAKPAGPESMQAAKQRCEALVFGGYDDWRLPNISEIHTIMPTVVPGRGHPYGAEPLLVDGAHQLWSSTMKDQTKGRYIDNYWNFGNWGDNDQVPVDDAHPLGRDVMNDDSIEADNANSVFSICIRGGHL